MKKIFFIYFTGAIHIVFGLVALLTAFQFINAELPDEINSSWLAVFGFILILLGFRDIKSSANTIKTIELAQSLQSIAKNTTPKEKKITLIPTKSLESEKLVEGIVQLLKNYDDIQIQILDRDTTELTPYNLVSASLNQDLVIFDATREEDNDNFDLVGFNFRGLPSIVVVSRNYLPENWDGYQNTFYPSYSKGKMSNRDIISKLEENLDDLFRIKSNMDRASIPFKKGYTIDTHKFSLLNTKRRRVFISFRSKYEQSNGKNFPKTYTRSVYKLSEGIRSGIYGKDLHSHFYESGSVVYGNEVLTEQRRWYLLELISHHIYNCDEFWIYGASDHFDSWWTLGELAVVLHPFYIVMETEKLNQL